MTLLRLCVLAVGASFAFGACGGQGGPNVAHISDGAALTKLYTAIEAHPRWVTAQEVAAAGAARAFTAGSNTRCGFDPQEVGATQRRFVCSLLYRDSIGQTHSFLLSENADRSGVMPITRAQRTALAAYGRSRVSELMADHRLSVAAPNRAGGKTLAERLSKTLAGPLASQIKSQPRVYGTACNGVAGMAIATPEASVVTPGGYLVAGRGTSCKLAQVVATALGDSSQPKSAVLSVPDRATGDDLTFRCHALSSTGPVECVGGGVVVDAGSDMPPVQLPGTKPARQTLRLTCSSSTLRLAIVPLGSGMTGERAFYVRVTNTGREACLLSGYPAITLSSSRAKLAFTYQEGGGVYLSTQPPKLVTLKPGGKAWFTVAKYRCDVGELAAATSVDVSLPGVAGAWTLHFPASEGGGIDYCQKSKLAGPPDPGNTVVVSPIASQPPGR
jgi:hypothetical protein